MKRFKGKVAAITGAASGIGRSLAVQLAESGCELALSDVNETGLAETAAQARAYGVKVTSETVDVSDRDAVYRWAHGVVVDHGQVNFIFNNAGVALGATVEAMKYEDFEWLMGINFWGVVYGTKAFLPHLKASGDGHVVNISSVFGIAGIPSQSAYNAAKFAVRGFTESLSQELAITGAPVRATSVHPGGIKTNIARAARVDESLRDLGIDSEDTADRFERAFITSPDKAASIILRAVAKNRRRVLVGPDAYVFDWVVRLLPTAYQEVTRRYTKIASK
jgi:NAD(P)-dependent dehydrogenase (short-subunit alcohol dehydrogenase family)